MDFLYTPLFRIKNHEITPATLALVLLILIGARVLVAIVQRVLRDGVFKKRQIDEGRQHAVMQLIQYALYVFAALAVLQTVGIEISLLVAGSAALLVGVGLGLQKTFNDLVAGLIILFEGSIDVGDIVEIEKAVGRVVKIGLRSSKIQTRDGIAIIVPNSYFINGTIINWSHSRSQTRFSIKIPASYQADPKKVQAIINDCAQRHEKVVAQPMPHVRMQDFAESGAMYELLFWTADAWNIDLIKSDLRYSIFEEFTKNNIEIPYPQRVVWIKQP
ncbi:MAG TPA: hypothetical protein DCR35_13550 [Runella sp.]|nr:hypothetical protein [Runella sp.]HAO50225.1 hypothetical protein [Runella sp.]